MHTEHNARSSLLATAVNNLALALPSLASSRRGPEVNFSGQEVSLLHWLG